MKPVLFRCTLAFALACMAGPALPEQQAGRGQGAPNLPGEPEDARLPNGKLQRDEILKAEHAQNVKDAAELVELSQQLQEDLEKNDRYVFSLNDLKKTDDIEKLVKKIRSRMRHN